jgi:O-antigen/teichoic acid export membrane protein
VTSGFAWQGFSFLLSVVVFRLSSAGEYNRFTFLVSSATALQQLAAFGIPTFAQRVLSRVPPSKGAQTRHSHGFYKAQLTTIVWLTPLGAAVAAVIPSPFQGGEVLALALLLLLIVPAASVLFLEQTALNAAGLYAAGQRIAVRRGVVVFVTTVVGGLAGGVWGALLGYALGHGAVAVAVARVYRVGGEVRVVAPAALGSRLVRRIVGGGFPSLMASLLMLPINTVVLSLLSSVHRAQADVGRVGLAIQWGMVITLLGHSLVPVVMRGVAGLRLDDGRWRYLSTLMRKGGFVVTAAGGAAGVLVLATPLLAKVYGAKFQLVAPLLPKTAVANVVTTVSVVLYAALLARHRVWLVFLCHLTWAVSFVGATLVWVQRNGAGAVDAYLLAAVVQAVAYGLCLTLDLFGSPRTVVRPSVGMDGETPVALQSTT